jgi:hypothetical protein
MERRGQRPSNSCQFQIRMTQSRDVTECLLDACPETWRSHVRANLSERNGKLFPVASTFLSHTYHQRILST